MRSNMKCFFSGITGIIGGGYLGCKLGANHGILGKLVGGVIGAWSGREITKAVVADVKNITQYSVQALNWIYNTAKRSA